VSSVVFVVSLWCAFWCKKADRPTGHRSVVRRTPALDPNAEGMHNGLTLFPERAPLT